MLHDALMVEYTSDTILLSSAGLMHSTRAKLSSMQELDA
jgi:hypothetical protein